MPPKAKQPQLYGAADPSETEPFLASESSAQAQASSSRGLNPNAWTSQPGEDDLPDDFKIGVNVIDCDAEIRLAFIRKVYSILLVQLLLTATVALVMYQPAAVDFMRQHGWIIYIPFVGSFVSLFGVYWKRHQHPANLVLLGIFTMFEAMLIGTVTSFYESRIVSRGPPVFSRALLMYADMSMQVIQALFITFGVFFGLTIFTFQTKVRPHFRWAPPRVAFMSPSLAWRLCLRFRFDSHTNPLMLIDITRNLFALSPPHCSFPCLPCAPPVCLPHFGFCISLTQPAQLDFSSFAPFLFAAIWGLITASLIQIFLPFNATVDLVVAGFGVLLFSAFVLYDTQQIMKRLSVDEAILGALTLYLDFINLFLNVLRVVSGSSQHV
jgi:FtsH-binding integral membrane protein